MRPLPARAALLLCTLALTVSHVAAQTKEKAVDDAAVARAVDQYLSVRAEMGRFSGAVLIARGDRVILRKGYGFADVERRIAYAPETRHQIASITKMFVSMAALRLRERGQLRLEESVCTYLKECPEAWGPVTVRHLMRHTSGIPEYEEKLKLAPDKYAEFMARPDATRTIYEEAKGWPLDSKPGEKYRYNNTGYIVLGHVIEAASGRPFAEVITAEVLRPAGLKQTGILGHGPAPKNLAHGYTFGDIGWDKTLAGHPLTAGHLRRQPPFTTSPAPCSGCLYSTLDDLHRWSRIMDGGKFVSAAVAAEVFTPGLEGYGYGWEIGTAFGRKRLRHTGSWPGYTSQLIKYPDDGVTLVIFSNLDRALITRIVRDVSAAVFGKPFDMPVRGQVIKLTEAQIAALVGDYKTADGALLTVRKEPEYLIAEIKDQYSAGLIPLSPTEFYFPLADGRAVFTLDAAGRAARVNMRYSGEDHIAVRAAP